MTVELEIIELPDLPDMKPSKRFMAAVGGAVSVAMKLHFRNLGGTFWGEISDSTDLTYATENEATISVSPPQGYYLLHKIYGGKVTAKPPRKMLAIPANSVAKQAGWPSHWSNRGDGKLKMLFGKNGPYALALRQNLLKWGRKGSPSASRVALREGREGNWGKGIIMYWLKKEVTHKPNPHARPNRVILENVAVNAAQRYIDRMLRLNSRQ
jgi:hypothetical protein